METEKIICNQIELPEVARHKADESVLLILTANTNSRAKKTNQAQESKPDPGSHNLNVQLI